MLGRIAQRSPQFVDRRVQPVLEIDERAVAPELFAELLARDQIAGFGEQEKQNLEGLARETDTHSAFAELASVGHSPRRVRTPAERAMNAVSPYRDPGTPCTTRTPVGEVRHIYLSFQQFS